MWEWEVVDPVVKPDAEADVEVSILTEEVDDEVGVGDGRLEPEPEVPKGTPWLRRKYPKRPASVEPHHSLPNPGQTWLQSNVFC
jgi:hypothetical protein